MRESSWAFGAWEKVDLIERYAETKYLHYIARVGYLRAACPELSSVEILETNFHSYTSSKSLPDKLTSRQRNAISERPNHDK